MFCRTLPTSHRFRASLRLASARLHTHPVELVFSATI